MYNLFTMALILICLALIGFRYRENKERRERFSRNLRTRLGSAGQG